MRDVIITLIVLGSLPLTLKRPYIGVLMWVWISVMNPHRLSWGFAYSFPFAAIIAVVTLIGLLNTKDPKTLPLTPVVQTLFAFAAWMGLTTLLAFHPETSLDMLIKVMKTLLMAVVAMMLIKTKQQIHLLLCTLVGSIAYYGVKGGIFTVKGGATSIVWGPPGSFIEGNNEVALAFIVIIPLLYYMYLTWTNKWLRRAVLASILLCALAALGSYSRGALLGIAAMTAFLWWKSPKKLVTGAVLAMLVPAAVMFMPDKWSSRMDTINTYQQDESAMGRINAWSMAFHLALDRPLVGGGFEIYDAPTFTRYAPNPGDIHAAHSIYFQVLGEHGFVGLLLYLTLVVLSWRKAGWIIRAARGHPQLAWAANLATMIQVSMLGFGVGGAFLSLIYFDVPYYVLAIIVSTGYLVEQALPEAGRAEAGAAGPALPGQARGT